MKASNLDPAINRNRSIIMEATNLDTQKIIRLKRDEAAQSWAMKDSGKWTVLPWADTADAVSVVMWLKSRIGGTARFLFES